MGVYERDLTHAGPTCGDSPWPTLDLPMWTVLDPPWTYLCGQSLTHPGPTYVDSPWPTLDLPVGTVLADLLVSEWAAHHLAQYGGVGERLEPPWTYLCGQSLQIFWSANEPPITLLSMGVYERDLSHPGPTCAGSPWPTLDLPVGTVLADLLVSEWAAHHLAQYGGVGERLEPPWTYLCGQSLQIFWSANEPPITLLSMGVYERDLSHPGPTCAGSPWPTLDLPVGTVLADLLVSEWAAHHLAQYGCVGERDLTHAGPTCGDSPWPTLDLPMWTVLDPPWTYLCGQSLTHPGPTYVDSPWPTLDLPVGTVLADLLVNEWAAHHLAQYGCVGERLDPRWTYLCGQSLQIFWSANEPPITLLSMGV